MLVVDGSFEEQVEELAVYLDSLIGESSSSNQDQIAAAIEQDDKEAAIKQVVAASHVLQSASDKEYEAAYNLFIHTLTSSEDLSQYIPTVLDNLKTPPKFANGTQSASNIMLTLLHVADKPLKGNILLNQLQFAHKHELYEAITLKVKQIPSWLTEWNTNSSDRRAIYETLAEVSDKLDQVRSTEFLIRAVQTYTTEDDSTVLTCKAVNAVVSEADRYTYNDLLTLPAIKSLKQGSPAHAEILSILAVGNHADFLEFNEEYPDFFSKQGIDAKVIERKCKLLTLVNLAAKQDSRKLRYQSIALTLDIPEPDVETWVIDAIKTGLVEGRLSQTSQTFLIHRATMRTFDPDQWEEVSAKLASWKESLQGILEVVDNVRNDLAGGPQQLTNGYDGSIDDDGADEGPNHAQSTNGHPSGSRHHHHQQQQQQYHHQHRQQEESNGFDN